MHTISIIGVGRVGGSLALALPPDKYRIEDLIVRDKSRWLRESAVRDRFTEVKDLSDLTHIGSETLIIATQDNEISSAALATANLVGPETCVFHTSGSRSSSDLEPLRSRGCQVGSIHPLASLSNAELGATRFKGSYFCIEGDLKAVDRARTIVEDLGGAAFSIDASKKALYHGAAVMACGHMVALVDVSLGLMERCGLSKDLARSVLMPLVESTLENLKTQTTSAALTGTFARADAETVERHISVLGEVVDTRVLEIYLLLGDISLDLALEQGADAGDIDAIRKQILMAKRNLEC